MEYFTVIHALSHFVQEGNTKVQENMLENAMIKEKENEQEQKKEDLNFYIKIQK